jgi:F-type H+-transporting ATPase subunit delta
MIHAASRQALALVRERLNAVLPTLPSDGGASHKKLAAQLNAAADLLASQPRLRRTLGDPSTDSSARGDLASSLLRGKLEDVSVDLVGFAASQRWSAPWDLVDSLEIAADDALLSAAEQEGSLPAVEDELFKIERLLAEHAELSAALDKQSDSVERRQSLLAGLLAGKANPITIELLNHAVASTRKASLQLAIDDLLQASAARRERSIARVLTAAPLTADQESRLATTLTDMYGRQISVRTAVDPSVRGGLLVRVGDEVIDGTVSTRLADARAALAG